MTLTWWLKFFGVIILAAVNDVCWTKWTIAVDKRNAFKSGFWSSSIYVVGGLTIVSYVQDLRFMIAAVIGSFAGTYLTVKKSTDEIRN